jgi:hypothetical protein
MNKTKQVEKLIDRVPVAAEDDRMLLLMYWKVCDNVEIPTDVLRQIIKQGTKPDTILRYKRRVIKNLAERC